MLNLSNAELINDARKNYYLATKNESNLNTAIQQFEILKEKDKQKVSLAEVYIGSLTAMKATYTFWPPKKMEYANKGIKQMEKALENNQSDVEALFIYASTCYYLPFFFNKSDIAKNSFKKILNILKLKKNDIDKEIVINALKFIDEKLDFKDEDKKNIKELIDYYGNK